MSQYLSTLWYLFLIIALCYSLLIFDSILFSSFLQKLLWILCKQLRPRSDAAFSGSNHDGSNTYVTRTRSWVPMVSYMRLPWSNFCIKVFILLFSFSIFSDRTSLKTENEYNSIKTLTAEVYIYGNGWKHYKWPTYTKKTRKKQKIKGEFIILFNICFINAKTLVHLNSWHEWQLFFLFLSFLCVSLFQGFY